MTALLPMLRRSLAARPSHPLTRAPPHTGLDEALLPNAAGTYALASAANLTNTLQVGARLPTCFDQLRKFLLCQAPHLQLQALRHAMNNHILSWTAVAADPEPGASL